MLDLVPKGIDKFFKAIRHRQANVISPGSWNLPSHFIGSHLVQPR